MTWFPLHTNPYFLVSISCTPIWGSFVFQCENHLGFRIICCSIWGSFAIQFGDQLGFRIVCGPIWGSFAMCSIVRTIWGPGSFGLHCGDHLESRIICGPIWGSFGTCSNLRIICGHRIICRPPRICSALIWQIFWTKKMTILPFLEEMVSINLCNNNSNRNTNWVLSCNCCLSKTDNRPFYSCRLSDLTSEWQRGWSWPCFDTDLTAFIVQIELFLC